MLDGEDGKTYNNYQRKCFYPVEFFFEKQIKISYYISCKTDERNNKQNDTRFFLMVFNAVYITNNSKGKNCLS